jgi:hypothetical protein
LVDDYDFVVVVVGVVGKKKIHDCIFFVFVSISGRKEDNHHKACNSSRVAVGEYRIPDLSSSSSNSGSEKGGVGVVIIVGSVEGIVFEFESAEDVEFLLLFVEEEGLPLVLYKQGTKEEKEE